MSMMMRRSPCCPAIFADSFSVEADSIISWSPFGGPSWSFTGGIASTTGADAILQAAVYPDTSAINIPEPKRVAVQSKMRVSQSGAYNAQGQVWLGQTGGGSEGFDRIAAELDVTNGEVCGVLRLIADFTALTGNVGQMDIGPIARNEWHTLLLCYHWNAADDIDVIAVATLNDGRKFRLAINLNDFGLAFDSPPDGPVFSGIATRQLGSGSIDFDDFKLLPHKEDSTCGCCPDCSLGCFEAKDDFDRTEVGCCWDVVVGSGDLTNWDIDADELTQTTPNEQIVLYICSQAPRAFRWNIDVWLPTNGDKAGVVFADFEDSDNGLYYIAELEAGAECGKLRFRLVTRVAGVDSSADVGEYVTVPGLTAATWHRVTLCYNPTHGVLSASVLGYSHHVKEVAEPEFTPRVGIYVDGGGDYKFDNARLSSSLVSESDNYYYEYEANDCPCCFVAGCETDTAGDLFDECQWDALSATSYLRRVGWFGVNSDCTADSTQRVVVTFTAASYGDRIVVYLDWVDDATHHAAELTLNADISTQGTLKLYKDGVEIATLDVTALPGSGSLLICYDQFALTAVYGGTRLEELSEGNGGLLAAVEWDGTVEITGWEQSHHLYDVDCPDCNEATDCTGCDPDTAPLYFKVTVNDHCVPEFNGTFIVRGLAGIVISTSRCEGTPVISDQVGTTCTWRSADFSADTTFPGFPLENVFWIEVLIYGTGTIAPAGTWWIRVHIIRTDLGGSGNEQQVWVYERELLPAERPNCLEVSELAIPYFCAANGNASVFTPWCDSRPGDEGTVDVEQI